MDVEELARLASRSTDLADLFERGTIEDRDAFVRAVRDVEETLLRIAGSATPNAVPVPSDPRLTKPSFRNVPSSRNDCTRLLARSET